MKRLLLFLFLCASAFAANLGDIDSITIETNGWNALIQIYTGGANSTNGTFNFGLGTYNAIAGNQKLTLNFTSCGYDDTGATNTIARTIYGTHAVRFPYPDHAFPDTTNLANDVQIRVALSDYICSKDVSITANIVTNLYASAGATNATANGVSVVNNSVLVYPKAHANWTWPGWNLISATPYTAHSFGIHASAQLGRPLRVLRVICTDQHSHTSTNYVTKMGLDYTLGDLVRNGEYLSSCDLSGMTALDLIRFDFAAFPWVGDSGSVCDTTDGAFTRPTICYAPQTNRYDPNNTYGYCHAVVDASTGVDATGVAANNVYWATNQSPSPFLTINGALVAIKGTNGAAYAPTAHTDVSASFVMLNNGNYAWTGGSGAYGTNGFCWVTIQTNAGATTAGVVINSQSGNKKTAGLTKLKGVTITAGSASGVFTGENEIWFDGCVISNVVNPMVYQDIAWYLTDCTVQAWKNGIRGFGTENAAPALIRSCTITNLDNFSIPALLMGNKWDVGTSTANFVQEKVVGGSAPFPTPIIVYNNRFLNITNNSAIGFKMGYDFTNYYGAAIIQNVFEFIRATTTAGPEVGLAGDGAILGQYNFIHAYNTQCGHKFNWEYNETGSSIIVKQQNVCAMNLWDNYNIKSDTFPTQNGARWGNWPELYGVGYTKNIAAEITGVASSGSFMNEFIGLNGFPTTIIAGSTQPATCAQQAVGYLKYAANGSFDGSSAGSGNGNYRLLSQSPAMILPATTWVMPFDPDGLYRGLLDPPGVYASGQPRKGGGFFAP